MARSNYRAAKRRRELAKKKKQEEKRKRRLAKRHGEDKEADLPLETPDTPSDC